MKKIVALLTMVTALCFSLAIFVSCGEEKKPDDNQPTPPATVAVESVTVTPSDLSMEVDGQQKLTVKVLPENATDKTVTFTAADPAIAGVDASGTVTAKSAGSTVITVKTNDGGKTATCNVTVKEKPVIVAVESVSIAQKNLYISVEDSVELDVTVLPENATNKTVTFSSSDEEVAMVDDTGMVIALKLGTATITATTEDGAKTATCEVAVMEDSAIVTGVELLTAPSKTEYMLNQKLDVRGATFNVTFKDGSSKKFESLSLKGVQITGFDSSTAGEKEVVCTYFGYEMKFTVTVVDVQVEFVAPTQREYNKGAVKMDLTGGKFIVTENGVKTDVPLDDPRVKVEFNTKEVGKSLVNVTFNDGEVFTYEINVIERFFDKTSLKDAAYLKDIILSGSENCEITEQGLKVIGNNSNPHTTISVVVNKKVYGMRIKVRSEYDHVCFALDFNPFPANSTSYHSEWRGQLHKNSYVLHSVGGDLNKATKGTFEGLLGIVPTGDNPILSDYFDWYADSLATKLSSGTPLNLDLYIITNSSEPVSIVFEEIEFLTKDEYENFGRPQGEFVLSKTPTQTVYNRGEQAINLVGGEITVSEEGKEPYTVALPNPDVKVKSFPTADVTDSAEVVLEYWGYELKYSIQVLENTYSFNNLVDEEYMKHGAHLDGGATYVIRDGKLVLNNPFDWAVLNIYAYPDKLDAVGFRYKLEGAADASLRMHLWYGDFNNHDNAIRWQTAPFGASGKTEGVIPFSAFTYGDAWTPMSEQKLGDLALSLALGEPVQIKFSIDVPYVKSITILDFGFVTQAELDEANKPPTDIQFVAPAKTEYALGATTLDFTGGKFVVAGEDISLNDSRVKVESFDTSKAGDSNVILSFKGGESVSYAIKVVERYTDKNSLKDADYVNQMTIAGTTQYQVTEKGLQLTGSATQGAAVEFTVLTNKKVYGMRIKVSSESDGVCFVLDFDKTVFSPNTTAYYSNWKGQLHGDTLILHSTGALNGDAHKAQKGTFEGLLDIQPTGEYPNKSDAFEWESDLLTEKLSSATPLKLKLMLLTGSSEPVSITFEEIEFLTEEEYKALQK